MNQTTEMEAARLEPLGAGFKIKAYSRTRYRITQESAVGLRLSRILFCNVRQFTKKGRDLWLANNIQGLNDCDGFSLHFYRLVSISTGTSSFVNDKGFAT